MPAKKQCGFSKGGQHLRSTGQPKWQNLLLVRLISRNTKKKPVGFDLSSNMHMYYELGNHIYSFLCAMPQITDHTVNS